MLKRKSLNKVIVYAVILLFGFQDISSGYDISSQTLSTSPISSENSITDETAVFSTEIKNDIKFMSVVYSVAQAFFENGANKDELFNALTEKFFWNDDFLRGLDINIDGISEEDYRSDGVLRIQFVSADKKFSGVIGICPIISGIASSRSDKSWERMGEYAFFIENVEIPTFDDPKDMKGPDAYLETNDLLKELIEDGKVVEVFMDKDSGSLRANRIKWVEGYIPGETPESLYLGHDVSISQMFSRTEKRILQKWIREHSSRGSPVRFRVVLGGPAIGWYSDIGFSYIAHAGVRDNIVYIGSFLFRYLMREENAPLRTEILDNDEFRHLKGLDHGKKEESEKRLVAVSDVIKKERLSQIGEAIAEDNVNFMLAEMKALLADGDAPGIFNFLAAVNDVALSRTKFPVESTYPIKHAVSLLTKDEQILLMDILTGKVSRSEEHRYKIVVDELVTMLDEDQVLSDWVKVYAPDMEGRSFWQISPEIWHEAGGLARVMQYHGAGIKHLIGQSNVRFRNIEPHYQNRIDAGGKPAPLDYTNRGHITHPIQGELEEVAKYKVNVNGKDVNAIVSRGVNDLGIEIYLIRDEGGFYTHSLYNYRSPWETREDLPTWEEFSVFYSKASLELVRIIEEREKEALLNLHKKWKAPLLHLNDSQTALIAAYRKIHYDDDPILGKAVVAFTTHTYGNRREYPLNEGYGDKVLNFMGIPEEYREFFKHIKGGTGDVYDIASAGLRMSDWQGAVSRAHRDDVEIYDGWINKPANEELAKYYKDVEGGFDLIAVSNGDHRAKTMVYFTEKLKRLYGADFDVEDVSPEELEQAKLMAKEELRVSDNKGYYSSRSDKVGEEPMLDPGQMVVSYSGRLVPEKAGRLRAFTDNNIEEMVKSGIQVVIYGNVQSNNPASDKLRDELISLTERLAEKQYPGRLVFVPRFSLDDQRALLAASDVQVQDSHPATEAAGFTEADISSCGGIEVGTRRSDNQIGEGLFEAQGIPMDLNTPGEGNVLIPKSLDENSYLEVLMSLHDIYEKGNLKYYQATSVRLSRVLEARLTSAAYLREFQKAISMKERVRKVKGMENSAEEEDKAVTNSGRNMLMEQIYRSDPSAYAAYRVSDYLENSDTENAARMFFTCEAFQDREESLFSVADTYNRVIDMVRSGNIENDKAKDFFVRVKNDAMEFSRSHAVREAIQIMSIQALSILSWQKRGLKGASAFRITADPDKMVKAGDQKRALSFLSIPRESGINEAYAEGHAGFYWRGIEKLKKLGRNIYPSPGNDDTNGVGTESTVMYAMNHGFVAVPEGILADTWNKKISTLHETAFINDFLPGSFQTTSTGAGHFQAEKLDIKHVTEGVGLQINVRYDVRGMVEEVIAQKLQKGDWALALPGCVDYVINLGGLRFNDISVSLSRDEAILFNRKIIHGKGDQGMSDEDFARELNIVSREFEIDKAPYTGFVTPFAPALLERNLPETIYRWIGGFDDFRDRNPEGLLSLYTSFSSLDDVREKIAELAEDFKAVMDNSEVYEKTSVGKVESISVVKEENLTEDIMGILEKQPHQGSYSGSEAVINYAEANGKMIRDVLDGENSVDRLLRIPIEWIEYIGIENAKPIITAFQKSAHGFVEFYSSDRPEGVKDTYDVITKELPGTLQINRRTRSNTITLFPVFKGEVLPSRNNKRWGGEDHRKSIISPFGFNYDGSGMIRSVILGLRLSVIAKDESLGADSDFVIETFKQYKALCLAQGQEESSFDLNTNDILNMARGEERTQILSLNKLIKLLPIMPFNTEELRHIYNRFREVITKA